MLMSVAHPRPRTTWGETWRILVALILGFLLFAIVAIDSEQRLSEDRFNLLNLVEVVVGVTALVLLPWRRRWPLPMALLFTLMTAVSTFAVPAAGIVVISLATSRRWQPIAVLVVPWLVSAFAFSSLRSAGEGKATLIADLVISVLCLALAVVLGYYIGARRALFASLHERAETAEREQASRVASARANERARIAREMHDVLAHRISLVAMHSGALTYRTDLTPEETAQAATVIRDNAHLALSELRDVLGVLRSVEGDEAGSEAVPERPQPTLADLDELLGAARASGTQVDALVDLDQLGSPPDALSRNSYRIIQEVLTNARKHAPTQLLTLRVSGRRGDGITIEARNGIPADAAAGGFPSSGMGLTGITERAVLSGGTLTCGPDRRGDFVLRAWLPWAP